MKKIAMMLAMGALFALGAAGCEDEDEAYLERTGDYVENRAAQETNEAQRWGDQAEQDVNEAASRTAAEAREESRETGAAIERGAEQTGQAIEHGARRAGQETGEAVEGAGREIREESSGY